MPRKKKPLFKNKQTRDLVSDFLLAMILGMIFMAVFWLAGGVLFPAREGEEYKAYNQIQPFLALAGATLPVIWMLIRKTAAMKVRIVEGGIWLITLILFGYLLFSGRIIMQDARQEVVLSTQQSSQEEEGTETETSAAAETEADAGAETDAE